MQRSIDRDVMLKASELLCDPNNVVVADNKVDSDQPEEFHLINSNRNLAQNGLYNKITKSFARELLKVQCGVSVKVPRCGYYVATDTERDAMEVRNDSL